MNMKILAIPIIISVILVHSATSQSKPPLLSEAVAYEVLNLADGKRNVHQIGGAVSAIYGPVPLELVLEYLRALETLGVVRRNQ
ncbi:hypothetical protein BH20ACI2_BH20ACI2_08000 [soil metagenome]